MVSFWLAMRLSSANHISSSIDEKAMKFDKRSFICNAVELSRPGCLSAFTDDCVF